MLNEQVQIVVDLLPVIYHIVEEGSYVTVFDSDAVVCGYAIPEGEKPFLPLGAKMDDPTGVFYEVVKTGQKKHNYLNKEVLGVVMDGVLAPIKDHGQVVGVIIYTHPVERNEKVLEMAKEFRNTVSQVTSNVNDMTSGIESLFQMLTGMNELAGEVEEDVSKATDVVRNISRNASRSNILALNASIEAARSGEAGKGFAVVATEMGKLANDSGNSAKEIDSRLLEITDHLNEIVTAIKDADGVAGEHMKSVSGMQDMLKDFMDLAGNLQNDITK